MPMLVRGFCRFRFDFLFTLPSSPVGESGLPVGLTESDSLVSEVAGLTKTGRIFATGGVACFGISAKTMTGIMPITASSNFNFIASPNCIYLLIVGLLGLLSSKHRCSTFSYAQDDTSTGGCEVEVLDLRLMDLYQ